MPRYSKIVAPAIESLDTGRSSAARRPSRMASSLRPSAASIIRARRGLGRTRVAHAPWSPLPRAQMQRLRALPPRRLERAQPGLQTRCGKLSPEPDPNPPGFMAAKARLAVAMSCSHSVLVKRPPSWTACSRAFPEKFRNPMISFTSLFLFMTMKGNL